VADPTFEDTAVDSEGQLSTAIWKFGDDSDLRLLRPPTAIGPNVSGQGQYAFEFASEESRDGFWQDLNSSYLAGTTYQFSVALGLGQDLDYKSILALEFRTASNAPIASVSLLAAALPFEDFARRQLQLRVPMNADYIGQPIRIGFRFSGTGFSPAIDDVRVCAFQ